MKFITKSASSFHSSFSFLNSSKACNLSALWFWNWRYCKEKIIILSMMAGCSHRFANALPVINFSFSPAKTLEQIQMMLQWSVCILLLKLSHTKTKRFSRYIRTFYWHVQPGIASWIQIKFPISCYRFCSSLEILVKISAIQELGEPAETVAKQSRCNAIATYLQQADLVNTADVVRILGNDYTHYERKYPEHDFVLLKKYMEIFLSQIEVKYMIKHPPVARS